MSVFRRTIFEIVFLLTFVILSGCAKVQSLAESVELPTFSFATSSLFPAVTGQYYLYQISVGGGAAPYDISMSAGTLPSGLTLDSQGVLKGIPAADSLGTYSVEIQATDGKGVIIKKLFQLTVSQALSITTSSLPVANTGSGYIQALGASGGSGNYTWSATGLPVGVTIASSSGLLSGIPITAGNYTPTFTLVDSNGLTTSKSLSLVVASPLSISTTSLAKAPAGDAYADAVIAAGGVPPYSFSIISGSLPQGLSLGADGTISGTPLFGSNVRNSVFTINFQVKDTLNQVVVKSLTITVLVKPVIVKDMDYLFRPAVVGVAYSDQVKVLGGKGTLSFTATNLPSGLILNSSTGKISGSPDPGSAGVHTVNFQVTDANGIVAVQSKVLTIRTTAVSGESEGGYMTPVGLYNGAWAYPFHMVSADLNNDSKMDIVYGSNTSAQMIVMLGDGLGGFTKYAVTAPSALAKLAIADMDGDGHLDIVSTRQNADLTIFKGDSNWTNPASIVKQNITRTGVPFGLSLVDVNGDGKKDIITPLWNDGVTAVILNCGSTTTVSYAGNAAQACGVTGQSIINLHAAATIPSGVNPRDVSVADMNGDGMQDVVFTSYTSNYIGIALGNGNGTFGAPASTAIVNPRTLKTIDMNGDGKLDIVSSLNSGVSVLLGNGSGGVSTILSGSISDLGGTPEFFDVADINGDGAPDIALTLGGTYLSQLVIFNTDGTGQLTSRRIGSTTYSAAGTVLTPVFSSSVRPDLVFAAGNWVGLSRVVVLKNNNQGTGLDLPSTYYSNPPNGFGGINGYPVAGDLNQDGYIDVVTKIGGAASISFGSVGGFTLSDTTIPTGDTAANWWFGMQMALTDINLDGQLDIASANWNNGGAGTVTMLMGSGDGTFGGQASYAINKSGCTTSLGARSVDFDDMNRDGFIDMIVATGCSVSPGSQVYIYFGFGDGTFDSSSPVALSGNGSYADFAKVVDFDRDGKKDVIIANNNAYLQVFRGNGDGTFMTPSLTYLGIGGNISQLAIEDYNNDGVLDVAACSVNSANIAIALLGSTGNVSSLSAIAGNVLSNDYNNQLCSSIVAADWNGDGKMDLLQRKMFENARNNQGGGGIHIYYGVGNGTFNVRGTPLSEPNAGPTSQGLMSPMDLNNDGLLDLLIGTIGTNSSWGTLHNRSQ